MDTTKSKKIIINKLPLFNNIESFFLLIFVITTGIIIAFDYSWLDASDDRNLLSFFYNNEIYTHLMSVPLSFVLGKLYTNYPEFQWLSWLYFFCIFMVFVLYLYLAKEIQQIILKISFLTIVLLFLIIVMLKISITILTVVLVGAGVSVLVLRKNFALCILFLIIAFLLRTKVFYSLIPFIAVVLIIYRPVSFKKMDYLFIAFFCFIGAFHIVGIQMNNEYLDWYKFNKSSSYFGDYKGNAISDNYNQQEIEAIRMWYRHDDFLIPSSNIVSSAGNRFTLLTKEFNIEDFVNVLGKKFITINYHSLLLLSLLLLLFLLGSDNKRKRILLFHFFVIIFILLVLYFRDVFRVSFALVTAYFLLLLLDNSINNIKKSLAISFLGIVLLTGIIYNDITIKDPEKSLLIKQEHLKDLNGLLNKHSVYGFLSITIPAISNKTLNNNNILFNEKYWVTTENSLLLQSGWLSRHPFFYRNLRKKLKSDITVYEGLISGKIGYVIPKNQELKIENKLNSQILQLYNVKLQEEHIFEVVDSNILYSLVFLRKKNKDKNDSL